ncbi:MAG: radical SAM protein [Clostridia bacterium]|nr:radical SAM protein [Clostridia bacterium]
MAQKAGRHSNISIFIPHNGCPHRCAFCNQRTISGTAAQPTAKDVRKAVNIALSSPDFDGANAEIAFFGGSFTAIDRRYMIQLLEAANQFIVSGKVAGIRISTRPDAIDGEILTILKQYGVTSIELGAQSMRDEVLEMNRRGHTAQDVIDASRLIKEYGFSLGLQMMTGLYGDDNVGARYTARQIAALRPDTVRIYPTVVLEGTELAEKMRSGEYYPQGYEDAAKLCAQLLRFFEQKRIKVIKLGLHASDGVEGSMVGGAYHPAFRELCEGILYYNLIKETLREQYPDGGDFTVYVPKSDLSKATGQKKRNIARLAQEGWKVIIKGEDDIDGTERHNTRTCKIEPIHQPDSPAPSGDHRH